MPPKVKITKEEIVETTIALLRKEGTAAINARNIASALNCSTQPVFSNFATMEKLQEAVLAAIYSRYLSFLKKEVESGKYPPYKAYGMAYIRFAKEEKEMFKLLFMRDRTGEEMSVSVDFDESVQMIMTANSVTYETAKLMHLELWSCVHGIGVMFATSFCPLEWEMVSDMLTDVYQGLRAKHVGKEK